MKKLITGILALTMTVACFAGVTACSDKNDPSTSSSSEDNTAKLEALESAGEYLKELYREDVKAVSRDYTLPNTTSYDGTTFNVTWSVKVTKGAADSVKVEAGDEETLINVNEATEEEIEYVLTATISDDDDNSVTVDFNCKVNVIVADSIIAPVENTAYNMYIEHKGAYKNLLLTGKMDSQDKFFEMTMDNSKAANVYAENATGGYKFYIKGENDAKSYITLTEYKKEGKDYYGAHVSFSETGSVFYYDAVGCWACELENDTYFLGSYSTYETASASSSYYMTAENIGRNQFPLLIALPGDFVGGEIESELELPAADSELTIAQALEVAGNFEHDTYTKDKYYVTATVKEVSNTTYGNMVVTDGTNDLTIYGTWDSTGTNKYGYMTETKPVAGDTVKLYGVLGKYNETLQMKNGWIMSVTAGSGNQGGGSGDGGSTGGETTTVTTIAGALSAAEGTSATFSGTVSEIYQAWSDQHSNMSFYVTDGTDRILVFRAGTKVGIGDVVSVAGTVTLYNEKQQIAQGATVTITTAHVCSEFTEADCLNAAVCKVCGTVNGSALGHEDKDGNNACDRCGTDVSAKTITASKTIADLIKSEGWTNSTTKQQFTLDEVVTVKVNGGNNSGKAYTDHIRIYATDTPAGTLTISLADGYELVSIKVSTVSGTYAFLYVGEGTTDICNTTTEVSGSSVVLNSVKNGSDGKQVRVTAIEVVYKATK